MKRCSKCKQEKPVSEFNKNKRAKDGLYHWCRMCARLSSRRIYYANREKCLAQMRAYRERNRETIRVRNRVTTRARALRNKYRMSLDEYRAMLAIQGEKCAICGDAMRVPNVDHDHSTNRVRGILCTPCNQGLGFFQDNPELLRAAIRYLEGWLKKTA